MKIFNKETAEAVGKIADAADNLSTSQKEYNESMNERHANDMVSDSFLSKNIRPLVLLLLLFFWFLILILDSFTKIQFDETIIESIKVLTNTAFLFYFGSRGGEKMMKIYTRRSLRKD